ncbi:hypothetical protein [Parasediminibacterium sp. JCM 36343]|uniref:hypothetical protein n=1 Tax=Parasediminibacterium sp. JCM 36343 TaxID=3374279 RepID=UPI00397A0624
MNCQKQIKKLSIALLFVLGMNIAFASISFTGISDDKLKNSKFSLRNLNSFHHTFSLSMLKSSLRYKYSDILRQETNPAGITEINSMMRYERGNTTFIMPYKYKIKVPKFKTPFAPTF